MHNQQFVMVRLANMFHDLHWTQRCRFFEDQKQKIRMLAYKKRAAS